MALAAAYAIGCLQQEGLDRGELAVPLELDLNADEGPMDIGAADLGQGAYDLPLEQLRPTAGQLSPDEVRDLDASSAPTLVISPSDVPKTTGDWRTTLRNSVRSEPKDKQVLVIVSLNDVKFPWYQFKNRALTEENRDELIDSRKLQLKTSLDQLEARVASIGGKDIVRYWVAPAVGALLPARSVELIADWADISSAVRDDGLKQNFLSAYTPGLEGRNGTRAANFTAAGFRGQDGHLFGESSLAVRAAIYDDLNLNSSHPGFKNADGSSRISGMYICSSSGTCSTYTPDLMQSSHANGVLGVLGGSIEDGQDPNYSGQLTRLRRSGLSSSSRLYYYTSPGFTPWSSFHAMIQDAMSRGIDIVNHSWSIGAVCDRFQDFDGANQALRDSMDAGMLHVFSSGNAGPLGCTVPYPGTRPDGLKVGALYTIDSSQAYDTVTMAPYSGRGGMTIRSGGTTFSAAYSLVDLVAPGEYDGTYEWAGYPGGPYSSVRVGGTSYAAPSVAGNAVDLLNSFYALGWSGMDARLTQTYLLMMGDGYNADSGSITTSGMSSLSGAGRLKNHYMSSPDLADPWAWGCHRQTFYCYFPAPCSGASFTYAVAGAPHSAAITTWKAAMTWTEPDLNDAARLSFRVRNTCPAANVVVDSSADIRKRVKLLQSSISGKCLVYDVIASYLPTNSSRTFTVCDYFQSGNPGDH